MPRILLALLLLSLAGRAGTVDLVTLPERAGVQLTIYNSEDLTLVRESRAITLKRGRNELQFSWANTLIDPTSVELRLLDHAADVELVDTLFPGEKPQHLVWTIDSRHEGEVQVEVSYFTSGLTWSMDYVAVADAAEETLSFTGHVRVHNGSGEEYEGAQVRLIVGRINLVEGIAELARRRGMAVPAPGTKLHSQLRDENARQAIAAAERACESEGDGIVKEGLSEYFMFTIAGTETLRDGWSKRIEAVRAPAARFDTVYRLRAHQYGPRPVRFLVWRNDEEAGLGGSPLPDGRVRVLRENGDGGLSFLGEERMSYVPVRAAVEVNLGPDDRVGCETLRLSTRRFDFRFDGHPRHVTGWTEEVRWSDTARNRRDRPVLFEIQRVLDGDVEYRAEMETRLFDYRTVEARFTVPPMGDVAYPATVRTRHGSSQRQSRVALE